MAPGPGDVEKGKFWRYYQYVMLHRQVARDNKMGIVALARCSTRDLTSREPNPKDTYEVYWFDESLGRCDLSKKEVIKWPELKPILQDKFIEDKALICPPVIQDLILPLQELNWDATNEQHVALISKAKQAVAEQRARGKELEKELDKLVAVTDAEQGLPPKAPKPPKQPKKPRSAAAAAGTKQTGTAAAAGTDKASSKAKTASAAKGPGKAATAGKPKKAAAAAPAGGGRNAKGKEAAAAAAAGAKGQGKSKPAAVETKTISKQKEPAAAAAATDDELSSDFEAAPAAAGKKRKQQQEEATPAKKQKAAAAAGSSRKGVTGRLYPADLACKADDRRLGSAEYEEGNQDTEYVVECIVDEVEFVSTKKGKSRKEVKLLPKWQGYELDVRGWENLAGLKNVEAYQIWASNAGKRPAYFTAVSNDDAAAAYSSWLLDQEKQNKKKKK